MERERQSLDLVARGKYTNSERPDYKIQRKPLPLKFKLAQPQHYHYS